jgi:hypothetical protein
VDARPRASSSSPHDAAAAEQLRQLLRLSSNSPLRAVRALADVVLSGHMMHCRPLVLCLLPLLAEPASQEASPLQQDDVATLVHRVALAQPAACRADAAVARFTSASLMTFDMSAPLLTRNISASTQSAVATQATEMD